jgi:hypothetical protein
VPIHFWRSGTGGDPVHKRESGRADLFCARGKREMRTFVAEGGDLLRETTITGLLCRMTRTRNAAIQTIWDADFR